MLLGIGLVVGLVVGQVIAAHAQSSVFAMLAGDTAHVTCSGPSLSVSNQSTTALDLTCAPNPTTTTTTTTTTTIPATTTTTMPATGTVTVDQTAKVFGVGTVSTTVTNRTPEVVVAFVSADDATAGQTVSVSGGGLPWQFLGRTNAQRGDTEIWSSNTVGASLTVTATPAQSGKSTQLTVSTFAGASGVGAALGASAASGPPTLTLVPHATGSWVGAVGMDWDNATARTLPAGQVLDAQNTDSAGDTYWVQHAARRRSPNTPITLNDTAPTRDRWDLEGVEVTPGVTSPPPTTTTTATTVGTTTTTVPVSGNAPVLDPSTPAVVPVTNNVPSVVSPSFSPPAGSVLYATFSIDSLPGSGALVSTVTNTGSALAWHLTAVENHTDGSTVGGFVQVFWAYNPAAQSGITVTGTFNVPTKNVTPPVGGFQVLVFDHAAPDQTTAASTTAWNVTSLSAPSATIVTTAPNSLALGVFDNWDSSVTPTTPAGQHVSSIVLNPSDLDTYWMQADDAATPSPAAVTVNATAPANIHWHEIAWEILAG